MLSHCHEESQAGSSSQIESKDNGVRVREDQENAGQAQEAWETTEVQGESQASPCQEEG